MALNCIPSIERFYYVFVQALTSVCVVLLDMHAKDKLPWMAAWVNVGEDEQQFVCMVWQQAMHKVVMHYMAAGCCFTHHGYV